MRWLDDLFDKTKHLIQDINLRNSSGTEIDFATQTTLAAVLAKIIPAPATEAKQDDVITALGLLGTEAKLEAVRALLAGTLTTQLSGSNILYQSGNPYFVTQDCTVAGTDYNVDVNTALSRNAHQGFVKSKSTNAGTIQLKISSDGATFTANYMEELSPGESMSLDGMDVDTIRVKSSGAGDDVIVGVW